ncbi:LamG-like jellyroll fold domain-containing protein [Lutibacter maritimus]|uniref:Por secretion system C-terminal sorting domain-containing protein n=1 Tax=Lutibacter maritimus TaxID=593133 RepID=A0A1I6PMM1_9FLAO|nr:LamG-like jellyroll fold domain-containing protein [Lutibacter maritimus]SFS41380.1 Por secretion system C-terminal sorting domain-containing protein [Lutibacter maritimus]
MKKFITLLFLIGCFSSVTLYSQTVIHSASFESGNDGWTDATGNNFNRSRYSGGTPSASTGPSGAQSGTYYIYTEASSPNYPSMVANLVSPSFNLSGITNPTFSFYYHMYGATIGTLNVQVSTDGGATFPTTVWTRTGQDQTSNGASWTLVNVNLNAFIGQNIRIQLNGITGSGYTGDMAIDNISLTVTYPAGPEIDVFGNGFSITDGDNTPSVSDATEFGSVLISSYIEKTFTIKNIGTSTLNLTGGTPLVDISGNAAFTIVTQPSVSSIASGGADLTFVVRFSPSTIGTVQAVISIDSNDTNENPFNFTIQGTGSSASAFVSPGGVYNNLKIWLKANDGLSYSDGQGVSTWVNKGSGSNATVPGAGLEPTFRDNPSFNINFNPVVDFDNDNSTSSLNYSNSDTSRDVLMGTNGFYTQDIFLVMIPDVTISSSTSSMDIFCGDYDPSTDEKDGTGIGYGRYSVRFDNEVLSYAVSTTPTTPPADINDRGYGIAHTSTTVTYNMPGIVNSKNNSSTPTKNILSFNAQNIGNTEVGLNKFYNVNNSRFWLGRSEAYTGSFDGRIVEVITYSSRNDDAVSRLKIQSYLAIKYGITLHTGTNSRLADINYVDSNGSVIWDVTSNAGFNYDIAGIGRDDNSALNQKQSKSVNNGSLIAIGLGEVASTNNQNISNNKLSFVNDRDFLVWGNNNGNFNTSSEASRSISLSGVTTTFTPVSRKWKIIESQNDVPEVVISIPTASLTSNIPLVANEEYMLVVSDNSSFANSAIIDVVPFKVNGTNSEVWYDFDGTIAAGNPKYFTVAKATRVEQKRRVDFGVGEFLLGDSSLELTNNFTVSAWVQNNGTGGSFISKGTGFNFKINGSNQVAIDWNGATQVTSTNTIDTKWHHIALSYSAGTAILYIDGVLDKTVSSLSNPTSSNHKFSIGALYTSKNSIASFNGAVDEVRIWHAALSATEIRYIMNQEIEAFSTKVNGEILPQTITKNDIKLRNWSDLEAYYDMNSYYGTTVEDNSLNKYWARIKYLAKDKQVVENQTAPLPYQSTANGNWDTPATWLNNTVQYIPNTTLYGTPVDWNIVETTTNVNTTRGVTVLGLLNNTNELSINADNHLTISHYLLLNGVIDLDGESQLIQTTDSDFDNASTGYLERDQQGIGNKYRYNDWSSPVIKTNTSAGTPFTIADVLKDGTTPSAPGTIVFNDASYDGATSPVTLSTYWMYKYANSPDGDYSSWQQIRSTGNLNPGEGFLMKGTGDPGSPDQNYVFVGKPNNGDVTLTVSGGYDYLIGNPYPSAIDSKKFIIDNGPTGTSSITGAIYYWEHYGGDTHNLKDYQAGYGTYSLGGGVQATAHPGVSASGTAVKTPEQYLPVSQGFFVQGDADGGTIIFKNSQRIFETEAGGNSVFMKTASAKSVSSNKSTVDTRPKYRIGFDAPKIDHRQLLLTIDEETSDGYDWGYDAEIYEIFEDDIYWMIDDKKYVIQVTNIVEVNKEIPIGVVTTEGGLITIKIDALENIENDLGVYLKDSDTNQVYDITNTSYQTNLPAGEYHNKYSITFKTNNALSVHNESLNNDFLVYFNNSEKAIVLNNKKLLKINEINLYNILGQTIKKYNTIGTTKDTSIPINVSEGVYVIKVDTDEGFFTKKLFIN